MSFSNVPNVLTFTRCRELSTLAKEQTQRQLPECRSSAPLAGGHHQRSGQRYSALPGIDDQSRPVRRVRYAVRSPVTVGSGGGGGNERPGPVAINVTGAIRLYHSTKLSIDFVDKTSDIVCLHSLGVWLSLRRHQRSSRRDCINSVESKDDHLISVIRLSTLMSSQQPALTIKVVAAQTGAVCTLNVNTSVPWRAPSASPSTCTKGLVPSKRLSDRCFTPQPHSPL